MKNTDSLLYLLSAPTNSMLPEPSSMGGSNDLLIRSGRLVWALPYHGAGTSEPPPAVHGVSPSHPMEASFGDKLDDPENDPNEYFTVHPTYIRTCKFSSKKKIARNIGTHFRGKLWMKFCPQMWPIKRYCW
jgi:hypothetical protein